jgi:hypothetical protein
MVSKNGCTIETLVVTRPRVFMLSELFVLGGDGNLWLDFAQNGNWGQVPPPRRVLKLPAGSNTPVGLSAFTGSI